MTAAAPMGTHEKMEAAKLELVADVLRSGCPVRIRVSGTSMLPSIWPGDVLAVCGCQPSKIVLGDIVCFARSARFVVHRVIKISSMDRRTVWLTQGDSMARADEPFTEEQLLGKVVAIRRNARVFYPSWRQSWFAYCCRRLLDVSAIQRVALWISARLRTSVESELNIESLRG
ncbi:MAG TPA: signal peptidase I [Terriglobales bacterium]|nr:signal peptidase I [Terriglobales bacterium]